MSTELYLIRHGEAANNVRQNYIAGRSNHFQLTEKGVEQSRKLGAALLDIGLLPDVVYSSPAVRALQTARHTLNAMSLKTLIHEDDRLQEQDVGEWVGRVATEVFTDEQVAEIDRLGKEFRSPGGESFNDVGDRMQEWAESIADDGRIFAFTHGGAIRCFVSKLQSWSHPQTYQTRPGNASVSLLTRTSGDWQLEYIGKDVEEIK